MFINSYRKNIKLSTLLYVFLTLMLVITVVYMHLNLIHPLKSPGSHYINMYCLQTYYSADKAQDPQEMDGTNRCVLYRCVCTAILQTQINMFCWNFVIITEPFHQIEFIRAVLSM